MTNIKVFSFQINIGEEGKLKPYIYVTSGRVIGGSILILKVEENY